MTRRKKTLALASLIAVATAVFAGVAMSRSSAGPDALTSPSTALSLAQAQVASFPVYYAGSAAEKQPLTAILDGFNNGAVNDVDFIYGDCQPTNETGCAPPFEVQVWPACIRNLSLYEGNTGAVSPQRTIVRGAPAAFFEDGQRLEIQTGIVTIVIFARSQDQALRIAAALRGLNVNVNAAMPLPPPAAGALSGKLECPSPSGGT